MKIRVSTSRAQFVLEQFAEWLPDYAERFLRMAERCRLGLVITFSLIKPRRSLDQNAMYWSLVAALAQEIGMTKGQMHEEALCHLHGYDLIEFLGEVRKVPKGRSKDLTTTDFSDLLAIVQQWCGEMGVDAT